MNNSSRDSGGPDNDYDNNDDNNINATQQTAGLSFTEYTEYQVSLILWKTFPPLLLLVGGFGNVATICVMRRIKDRNSSQHAILISLAVSDLVLLCVELPRPWILYMFRVNLDIVHVAVCKLRVFSMYVSNTSSAWLVTCVTVQRTIAVLWPHRMRALCTVRRTWVVIATLALSACALNCHLLFGIEIVKGNRCHAKPGPYQDFMRLVFSWVDLCAASFLPSVCMIVCDVILSVSLFKTVSSSSSSSSSSSIAACAESSVTTARSRKRTFSRTTVMVLAVSCAFLVFTLPICVRIVWFEYNYESIVRRPQTHAVSRLMIAVTQIPWMTNSAINFVLYCLTGTKFRREFVSWIRCCCWAGSPSAPSVHEAAPEASREGRHQHRGNSVLSK